MNATEQLKAYVKMDARRQWLPAFTAFRYAFEDSQSAEQVSHNMWLEDASQGVTAGPLLLHLEEHQAGPAFWKQWTNWLHITSPLCGVKDISGMIVIQYSLTVQSRMQDEMPPMAIQWLYMYHRALCSIPYDLEWKIQPSGPDSDWFRPTFLKCPAVGGRQRPWEARHIVHILVLGWPTERRHHGVGVAPTRIPPPFL